MDSGSVVSSLSVTHSFDFTKRSAGSCSSGQGGCSGGGSGSARRMVQRPGNMRSSGHDNRNDTNNEDSDIDDNLSDSFPPYQQQGQRHDRYHDSAETCQYSDVTSIAGITDLSFGERPCTRDTHLRPGTRDTTRSMQQLVREASTLSLSAHPDRSNFREKLRNWTVHEDASSGSPYLAPRPTTSLVRSQKSGQGTVLMASAADLEREMSILLSRPSTSSFPAKPKELVEPLDGLLPPDSPVSQRKFLVLPSIGSNNHLRLSPGGGLLWRQRSNLETTNQLDYSRETMEEDADFFASLQVNVASPIYKHYNKQYTNRKGSGDSAVAPNSSPTHPKHGSNRQMRKTRGGVPQHPYNPRESPTKPQADTPLPLPPIPSQKHTGSRRPIRLRIKQDARTLIDSKQQLEAEREEDNGSSLSCFTDDRNNDNDVLYDTDLEEVDEEDEDDEEDIDRFRQKTPETYRSDCASPPIPLTPPPDFR